MKMLTFSNKKDLEDFLDEINSLYPIKKGYTTTLFLNKAEIRKKKDINEWYCKESENLNHEVIKNKYKAKFKKENYSSSWASEELIL